MDCEGNCGTQIDSDGDEGGWKILAPDWDGREFTFCSLKCLDSWLAAELAY